MSTVPTAVDEKKRILFSCVVLFLLASCLSPWVDSGDIVAALALFKALFHRANIKFDSVISRIINHVLFEVKRPRAKNYVVVLGL